MTTEPAPIKDIGELKAALQLAIGLELSTIPVYLTALYSIKDGTNTDAAQAIRSVVMEEMLHMVLAVNVLNALGEKPSVNPVNFRNRRLNPIPRYPHTSPLIPGIGELALRPLTPAAVDSFIKIEHPYHGAVRPDDIKCARDAYPTIGTFYEAIQTALQDLDGLHFHSAHQVKATQYYGGAGEVIEVKDRETALKAIGKIIDEGEGLPPNQLDKQAKKVTTQDKLNSGWQMYSHYARFRELQTGRRYRSTQLARETPEGSLLLVDYSAVHPAKYIKLDDAEPQDSPESIALNEFDAAYTQLVNDLYLAFSGKMKPVKDKIAPKGEREADPLLLAVHGMRALKDKAVALMRTPNPANPTHTLCPRFHYASTP